MAQDYLDPASRAFDQCRSQMIAVEDVYQQGHMVVFNYSPGYTHRDEQVYSDMWYMFGVGSRLFPDAEVYRVVFLNGEELLLTVEVAHTDLKAYAEGIISDDQLMHSLAVMDYSENGNDTALSDNPDQKGSSQVSEQNDNTDNNLTYGEHLSDTYTYGPSDNSPTRSPFKLYLSIGLLLVSVSAFIAHYRKMSVISIVGSAVLGFWYFTSSHQSLSRDIIPDFLNFTESVRPEELTGEWVYMTLGPDRTIIYENVTITQSQDGLQGISAEGTFRFHTQSAGKNTLKGQIELTGLTSDMVVNYDRKQQRLNFEIDSGAKMPTTLFIQRKNP